MKLTQLLYVSDAVKAMTPADLEQILDRCRVNNGRNEITGLLLYGGGHFIQLLEGHQPTVEGVFAKVREDPRHRNVQQLRFTDAHHRMFPEWRMGLLNLDTMQELDRSRLRKLTDRLNDSPNGVTILSLMREFRDQLPANDGVRGKAA